MTSGAPDLFDLPDDARGPGSKRAVAAAHGSDTRLRAWQRRAIADYFERPVEDARDFLVTATPGSGKTTFALALAMRLRDRRAIDRIVVVAPTDHLRTQWAEAAARVGLDLDPTLSNAVGPVRADAHGYVTTYAQVATKPALHHARSTARRTLVVLDEVHHAGDGLSWGEAVSEAFGGAVRRLSLTGTPFRTRADEQIPFVKYTDDGDGELRSVADVSYGYREALRDGVVRPVVFAAYTGVARWRTSAGEVVAASLTDAGTRSVEAAAWKTALDPKGAWVPHVLAALDDRIDALRNGGMPDAAGLVLASDQETARAYADIVERVTGRKPALIVSDDPQASERLSQFAASDERIAVCVRMVSEGVDIPRVAALAWLTSYRTPLFFAQAVGRVVRARGRHESATVFLPAVRPLLTLAAELEQERNHVLVFKASPETDDLNVLDELVGEPETADGTVGEYEALEAEAEFAHVLSAGRAVVADLSDDDEEFVGLPGLLSAEQTASLLARRDVDVRKRVDAARRGQSARLSDPIEPPPAQASWRAAGELRREVNRLVGAYAARSGSSHAQVHGEIRRAVPGPPSASAPADVLEARRDHLLGMTTR